MERLIEGYRSFRTDVWPERRAQFERLAARGQQPHTMVIACCDSRVDPTMIFNAGPGELFVVRNVANLVPPYAPDQGHHSTSAALEFGVTVLQVADLIVLGHGMCGGIRALLAPSLAPSDFVGPWMSIARAARDRAVLACTSVEQAQTECEGEAVKVSLDNLRTFPWIAERVADGRLRLHGASFDIRFGVLELLQPDGRFVPA
jgi:carbonic anhydrase